MNEQKHLDLSLWKRIIPYLKRVRKYIFIVMFFLVISAVGEAAYPLFTRYAVNHFVMPRATEGLLPFALSFGAVIAAGGIAVIIYCRDCIVLEMEVGRMLKRSCFIHLQELPVSFYSTSSVGYLLARVMSDTDRISGVISWSVSHMLWNICYIIGAVVFMFITAPRLALILLVMIPVAGVITWFFQRRILVINRRVRHINSQITGAYNEGITGAKTSKALVIEHRNTEEFRGLTSSMYRESIRHSMQNAVLIPLITFCGSIAAAVVLWRGGILVMSDVLDYGVLSAFISYAVGIIEPVSEIARMLSELITAQVGLERVTSLLDEPCTISDPPEVEEKYGTVFAPKKENWEKIEGRITFDHVWFRYPDGGDYVLEDFCLDVPAGTAVAIVGETGAGKSTLVNLACRFQEPTKGRILIDGTDYRERSQLWLHSSLGYVLQDPHLFSGSVADNIRYGRLDATDEEIRYAARLAAADGVIAKLPQGYDTPVGEGGDRLSTGEKQLVSFARAILADPAIFVFDEATSSIDTETEQLIQQAITNILKGRTSFMIAHRLSTIRRADLILVVSDGKIIERGTHDELIAADGKHASLYRAMQIDEAK